MKKLSRREALEKMRDMWLWISKETEKRKYPVSKEAYIYEVTKKEGEVPKNECYACEYAFSECLRYFDDPIDTEEAEYETCNFCPVDEWKEHPQGCVPNWSPYYKWAVLGKYNWINAAKYAREIATLAQGELEKMKGEYDG